MGHNCEAQHVRRIAIGVAGSDLGGGVIIIQPKLKPLAASCCLKEAVSRARLYINAGLHYSVRRGTVQVERPIATALVGYGFSRFRTERVDALLSKVLLLHENSDVYVQHNKTYKIFQQIRLRYFPLHINKRYLRLLHL
ncbi:hypothetical protein JS73_03575 [Synergistes jonesii]|nr:hypothetical protein JS73_03575 [Synergistes jonesii]OFB65378.1 hypothetical protein JS79_04175 [Synergistes jonesii]OFB68417.1 hypothetical protein JS78_03595 [Synergistes jonesii]OFB75079.1 hypothetical protein JS77_03590 [Synergistes jonesii]